MNRARTGRLRDRFHDVALGVWAVGVTATGNMLGLSHAEHDALEAGHRADLLMAAGERMLSAGAHAVISGIGDLPTILPTLGPTP